MNMHTFHRLEYVGYILDHIMTHPDLKQEQTNNQPLEPDPTSAKQGWEHKCISIYIYIPIDIN